jgi:hypothetical protein
MATKIQPINKTKTVYCGDILLQNFWRIGGSFNYDSDANKNKLLEFLHSIEQGTVCIYTESLTEKDIIKQIFDISQNFKVRFYILVNEYSKELDLLNGHCLIRYDLNNKGSFILANPNSDKPDGIFFTGFKEFGMGRHFLRSLNKNETIELFRHFCFQFWETAKKEVIEKGKHNEVISKPLDIFHDVNAFGGKDFVYGTLFDFIEKASLSEFDQQLITFLNQESQSPSFIKHSIEMDAGIICSDKLLPKSEFENQEPVLDIYGVSLFIYYYWKISPFYLPEKATVNSLYEKWEKQQDEILKQLDAILQKIKEVENKESGLSKKITRFFLGKKNVFGALKNEIEVLKATVFANLPEATLKEKTKIINEIHEKIQNEIGEIETENRKAKLDEEIENLQDEISKKENEMQEKENTKQEKELAKSGFEKEIASIETELKCKTEAFDLDKKEKLRIFCEKQGKKVEELGKFEGELQQKSGKKNKNKEESIQAQKILDELKSIKTSTNSDAETKDLIESITMLKDQIKALFLQKTIDEINNIQKQIDSLNSQKESKKKEKDKIAQSSTTSFLNELVGEKKLEKLDSEKLQIVQIPDLKQLPTIGELFQVNSQAYLAIEFWEEYDKGKSEATRLNAKLCAIKN